MKVSKEKPKGKETKETPERKLNKEKPKGKETKENQELR